MNEQKVYYVSEHRGSFNNKELINDATGKKDFVIIAISVQDLNIKQKKH